MLLHGLRDGKLVNVNADWRNRQRVWIVADGALLHDDLRRLAAVGPNCYLVGESLMRQRDVAAAVRVLLGDGL